MARYVQRISLLGKERWIGWEIDGVGTEVAGLQLADGMSDEELRERGIKEFRPLPFENFLSMGLTFATTPPSVLLDEDVAFRLDALQVVLERLRRSGQTEISRSTLGAFFDEVSLEDPRVRTRLRDWEASGAIELTGDAECYLRIRNSAV
jgi:hypothetical protein